MKKTLFDDEAIGMKKTICILIFIMVFSGFCGFVYETFFYLIDLGYFTKRGSTFGPWIPIYAFGGLAIALFSYRFKKHPIVVFVLDCIITGAIEYFTGYVLLEFFHKRLWDYNIELWNWGNVNGFICVRSVLLFGLSGLLLVYGIIPVLKKIVTKVSERKIVPIAYILAMLFIVDMVMYSIVSKNA